MKKILSVLLLGTMLLSALASCGGDEADTTTGGASTTTAAATTTAPSGNEGNTTTTAGDEDPGDDPTLQKETPMIDEEVAQYMSEHEAGFLNSKINMDSLLTNLLESNFFEDGYFNNLFDNVYDATDWATAEAEGRLDTQDAGDAGDGKMGTFVTNGFFYWGMTEPVKLDAYIIYTGNDNSTNPARLPVEWYLYGSNTAPDPNALMTDTVDLEAAGWKLLDYVFDGAMADADFAPHGYKIDADKQGEYQYYCWYIYDGGYYIDLDGNRVIGDSKIQMTGMKLYAAN